MHNAPSAFGLPPSGPWTGYYAYPAADRKHRMKLHLNFTNAGVIEGDGVDDIGSFLIHGVFAVNTREARWRKAYVGMHSVEYSGVHDGRNILGTWTLDWLSGPFRIWPGVLSDDEAIGQEAEIEDAYAIPEASRR